MENGTFAPEDVPFSTIIQNIFDFKHLDFYYYFSLNIKKLPFTNKVDPHQLTLKENSYQMFYLVNSDIFLRELELGVPRNICHLPGLFKKN